MKIITGNLWIAVAVLMCVGMVEDASGQFFDSGVDLPGVAASGVTWGDYDNDGRLDLALAGDASIGRISRIYHSNSDGTFTDINAGLTSVRFCSLAWGDYDNDGRLDLALAGDTSSGSTSRIYHNNGDGTFTDISAGLIGVRYCSLAWGDYDNDGRLDLALAGDVGTIAASVIYHNNGDGTFVDSGVVLKDVSLSSLAWGDYDGDGDLDLALAGDSTTGFTSRIYRNEGDGAFTDINAGLVGVIYCSLAWGDYDNDGDLDIALAGWADGGRTSKIYRNGGNSAFIDINAGLIGLDSASLAWGDYDNDGYLDLALTGWDVAARVSKIYRNHGDGTFNDIGAPLPLVASGSVTWSDWDNDGDLDITLTRYDGTRIFNNNAGVVNTPPTSPGALTSSFHPSRATFRWNAATDAQTTAGGLSYNLRVGTVPGGDDMFCGTADPTSGWRRLPAFGNAQKQVSWTLRGLGQGPYYWSVQAVDTAFAGSPWAAEAIVILDSDDDGDPNTSDCATVDPMIHHGAAEICNDGVDNNCDGLTDAADPQCQGPAGQVSTFYRDADGDGFGDPDNSVQEAGAPVGYVTDNTDCNDANAEIHPGAGEVCNDGIDNDCNGRTDGTDPACTCGMCGTGMGLMMPFAILVWMVMTGVSRQHRTPRRVRGASRGSIRRP